jgi:CHAT domain-containing protein
MSLKRFFFALLFSFLLAVPIAAQKRVPARKGSTTKKSNPPRKFIMPVASEIQFGKTVEEPLNGEQIYLFIGRVRAAEAARFEVEERGVNVILKLYKVDGSSAELLAERNFGGGFEREILTFAPPEDTVVVVIIKEGIKVRSGGGTFKLQSDLGKKLATDISRIKAEDLLVYNAVNGDKVEDGQARIKALQQSLEIWSSLGDRYWFAYTANMIGLLNWELSNYQEALKFYNLALDTYKEINDTWARANVTNNISQVALELGDIKPALNFLLIARDILAGYNDTARLIVTNNNIGRVYLNAGQPESALPYLQQGLRQAILLRREAEEAFVSIGLGGCYLSLNRLQDAEKVLKNALRVSSSRGDDLGTGIALHNLAEVYERQGNIPQAISYYQQSLLYERLSENELAEANTLTQLARVTQKALRANIFYGKLSLKRFQTLRRNTQDLDIDSQRSFLKSVEWIYREVANFLINEGRLEEAQQVLNSFKDQEYFDSNPLARKQLMPPTLTRRELEFDSLYHQKSEKVRTISKQIEGLKNKISDEMRREDLRQTIISLSKDKQAEGEEGKTADMQIKEDEKQLRQLETALKTASDEFLAVLKKADAEFAQPVSDLDRVSEIADTRQMQTALRDLQTQTGKKVVAIYTLESKDAYSGLLITPDRIVPVSYRIEISELRKKNIEFLRQLSEYDKQTKMPKFSQAEVQRSGQELYEIVFAPFAAKLKELQVSPDVVMWSLDGSLRYIPIGSLYDGKQYLAERYCNVVFTRADSKRMTAPVSPTWTGSGFYGSKEFSVPIGSSEAGKMKLAVFDRLQYAKLEVESLFGTKQKGGIIDGHYWPDEQFTKQSLFNALKLNHPLVHIASHFKFEAGDWNSSFLLMGDGTKLTLEEIKREPDDLFKGVELLTLSACETGVQQERKSDGREIDAFAELAQRKGASAVVASLWKVDDESTSQLMLQFYKTRQAYKLTKAEALQKAQLSLLKDSRYAHPYYWATFILFGNWR